MADHTTAGIDLDREIEELAMKHIAVGWAQAVAINGHNPDYRQTAQFHRLKAFTVDLLARRSTSGSDVEFLSKRLARVAELVGAHIPAHFTHEQVAEVAGTILGEVARLLEKRKQASGSDGTAAASAVEVAKLLDTIAMMANIHQCGVTLNVLEKLRALLAQQAGAPAKPVDERALFEAKYAASGNYLPTFSRNGDYYENQAIQIAWYGWQLASTAASQGWVIGRAAPAPAAQDEQDAKDAARYRWLRKAATFGGRDTYDLRWYLPRGGAGDVRERLDAAIDAAMSQSKQGTAGPAEDTYCATLAREAGLPAPRTCKTCGLGPCKVKGTAGQDGAA